MPSFRDLFRRTPDLKPVAWRSYHCRCGKPIFFRNSQCLACKTPLGYEPQTGKMVAVEEGHLRCANFSTAAGCNWLTDSEHELCRSCRLDRTIPDLSSPQDAECYRRISIAKRRLVSLLIALDLPVASRVSEDPQRGVAFDFLRSPAGGPRVLTGHDDGIITLNIEEAEDSTREFIREQMGEPYRTLLGHLRHETAHYYWDRLIRDTPWIEDFRKLFGDESPDYAQALQAYYQNGPRPDWNLHFVTAYACSHPWEDWAETWAHYMHMVDTLDTALSFGLDPSSIQLEYEPLTEADGTNGKEFLSLLNSWNQITGVLNELSRAMGLHDFYPFVLSKDAARKLQFIHTIAATTTAWLA